MGYYYVRPLVDSETDIKKRGQVQGGFLMPEKSVAEAVAVMKPLENRLENFRLGGQDLHEQFSDLHSGLFAALGKESTPRRWIR